MYKEKEEEIAVYTKKETDISSKLEKDYKNFTINFDSDDLPYIDGKYYQKVNIDRLVKKKDDYENMLNELFEIKKYQIDNSIALDNIEINYIIGLVILILKLKLKTVYSCKHREINFKNKEKII